MSVAAKLPGSLRLKTQRDFRAVYSRGRRAAGEWVTVVVWPRRVEAPLAPRLGLSVSKDHGGAVRRNKLKRVLREAFRLERDRMPRSCDVVLIPKRRDEDLPLAALRVELPLLVEKAFHKPAQRPKRRRRR